MKNQFVTYQISTALKVLGFNDECIGFYENENRFLIKEDSLSNSRTVNSYIAVPLWQQVIDWFRSKGIVIEPVLTETGKSFYAKIIIYKKDEDGYITWYSKDQVDGHKNPYSSYEYAREVAINKAIEIYSEIKNA